MNSEVKSLSRVRLFATPWTVAYRAPLSMEFSRQEYWRGLPFPSPGDCSHIAGRHFTIFATSEPICKTETGSQRIDLYFPRGCGGEGGVD